jgi:hypothetical protein
MGLERSWLRDDYGESTVIGTYETRVTWDGVSVIGHSNDAFVSMWIKEG